MLQFLTRTGTLTRVMPRLYVSCHPDDFEQHFRTICSDVFAVQENCAVFYEENPAGTYDENELFTLLSEIQLIVVPVTRKLLGESSRALDVELPYALSHNITILPILAEADESGELIDAFNKSSVFIGLQFLNRFNRDPTALRYEDKLATFLSSVMVNEEEVQRIQDEFSSKIFLSYRKKDREHAQDLMRRIHKVDICRDTAIWYDEYLIPGESFDSNIMSALDESDVFVMSVTSSFEEPGNYVADHEYPNAVRKSKPLIAAEMKRFNQPSLDNLESLYPGINALMIDPDDMDRLGKTLRQRLIEEAGVDESVLLNDDGEHLYYIALAYKNGIRTETDAGRAADLFRMSANNGCYESYLRLIKMYRIGDGIPRNYNRALSVCEKALGVLLPLEGSSLRTDNVLASVYEEEGHICADLQRNGDSAESYRSAYELRRRMHSMYEDAPLDNYCESMISLASTYYGGGMSEEARFLAEQFLSDTGLLMEDRISDGEAEADDIGILRIRTRICNLMSAVYLQLRMHSEVTKYAKLGVTVCEQIEAVTGTTEDLSRLADSYLEYADFLKIHDLNEANAYIEKYNEIRARLDEYEEDRPKNISDAIDTFRIADNTLMRRAGGDALAAERARILYDDVLDICKSLTDRSDRYSAIVLTAKVYGRFGDMEKTFKGSGQKAVEYFEKALAICRDAEKEFRNDLQLMRVISEMLDQIGSIHLSINDLTNATQYFTDALEVDMRASKIQNDPNSGHNLAKSYMRCAEINSRRGHQPVANVNYKSALKILEPLADERDDYRIIEDLALAYFRLGMSDRLTTEQRLNYCSKASDAYNRLMGMTNSAEEYERAYKSVLDYMNAIS
ncbi:MAG: hypothetical protein ACOYEL_05910 [Saccharofermentanales bacterium]|jgi:tetratricopeptide (TPR) repeat protein